MHYATALYDGGHAEVFAMYAHRDLTQALTLIPRYPHFGDPAVRKIFARRAPQIEDHFDLEAISQAHTTDGWSMGASSGEQPYRHWCMQNILLLNSLNNVVSSSLTAREIIHASDFVTPIGHPPSVIPPVCDLGRRSLPR